MKKAFINRVKREKIVDTRNYRYHLKINDYYDDELSAHRDLYIERLPIGDLGTTAALEPWEVIYIETVE